MGNLDTAWGRIGRCVVAVLVAGCVMAEAAHAGEQAPPDGAEPLPVERTTTVRGRGTVWYVDGPTVIPPSAEIRIELGTRIVGINNASLDVQGGLKIHGTEESWVVVENIDFSPTLAPKLDLHLDMVDFRGCKFTWTKEQPFTGLLTLENACVQRGCTWDMHIASGFVKIMTVEFVCPCVITCVPADRKPVEVDIRTSWMKATTVKGPGQHILRHCEFKGDVTAEEVDQFEIDGCDIFGNLVVRQPAEGSFKDVTLTKCSVFEPSKVILERPPGEKPAKDRVKLDKFYWGPVNSGVKRGHTEKELVDRIVDGDDADEGQGTVFAVVGKSVKRPHGMLSETLRRRAPPVH